MKLRLRIVIELNSNEFIFSEFPEELSKFKETRLNSS